MTICVTIGKARKFPYRRCKFCEFLLTCEHLTDSQRSALIGKKNGKGG